MVVNSSFWCGQTISHSIPSNFLTFINIIFNLPMSRLHTQKRYRDLSLNLFTNRTSSKKKKFSLFTFFSAFTRSLHFFIVEWTHIKMIQFVESAICHPWNKSSSIIRRVSTPAPLKWKIFCAPSLVSLPALAKVAMTLSRSNKKEKYDTIKKYCVL